MNNFIKLVDYHCEKQLKAETLKLLQQLDCHKLPLHLATINGGFIDYEYRPVFVYLKSEQTDSNLLLKLIVYFKEITICCGCGDEPQSNEVSAEMLISIDKISGEAEFSFV